MLSYKTLLKLFVNGACSLMKKKCKVVHYGHSNPNLDYYMNGVQLPKSTSERDLGVHSYGTVIETQQTMHPSSKKSKIVPVHVEQSVSFSR